MIMELSDMILLIVGNGAGGFLLYHIIRRNWKKVNEESAELVETDN